MNQRGFTLIELLVVLGIVIFLSGMIFVNYRAKGGEFSLQRAAYKLAQDIRRAAELAMSAREFEGAVPMGGYGIHLKFPTEKTSYILYADENGNEKYDAADGIVETIFFEEGVEIKNIPQNDLSINFRPPNPKVKIGGDNNLPAATITLSLQSDASKTRAVRVNNVGLVEVE